MTRQLLQENDFTERTLRVCRILESIEVLLESDNFFGALVDSFPDNTIGSLTYRQKHVQAMTASLPKIYETLGRLKFKI